MPIHMIPGYDEAENAMSIDPITFDGIQRGDILTVEVVADDPVTPGATGVWVKAPGFQNPPGPIQSYLSRKDILAVRSPPRTWSAGDDVMAKDRPAIILATDGRQAWVRYLSDDTVGGSRETVHMDWLQPIANPPTAGVNDPGYVQRMVDAVGVEVGEKAPEAWPYVRRMYTGSTFGDPPEPDELSTGALDHFAEQVLVALLSVKDVGGLHLSLNRVQRLAVLRRAHELTGRHMG